MCKWPLNEFPEALLWNWRRELVSFGGVKVVNKMLREDAQGTIHYIVFDT